MIEGSVQRARPPSHGSGAQVKPLHFTAHKASRGGGTGGRRVSSSLPSPHLTRKERKERPDNEANAGPCGKVKPDEMESLSLPPPADSRGGGCLDMHHKGFLRY